MQAGGWRFESALLQGDPGTSRWAKVVGNKRYRSGAARDHESGSGPDSSESRQEPGNGRGSAPELVPARSLKMHRHQRCKLAPAKAGVCVVAVVIQHALMRAPSPLPGAEPEGSAWKWPAYATLAVHGPARSWKRGDAVHGGSNVIWSSEQGYMEDALAIVGEEGRGYLR